MDKQKQNVQLSVPAILGYSQVIRHIAGEIFSLAKFSKAWQNRLMLVVDELFMNAVLYGSKQGTSTVRLTFYYDDNKVVFSIEDEGTGKKRLSVDELKKLVDKNSHDNHVTKTSGRGLAMIASLWTDDIDIESSDMGGIKVVCTKKIDDSTPPPQPALQQDIPEIAEAKKMAAQAKKPTKTKPKSETIRVSLSGEIDQSNMKENSTYIDDQIKRVPANGTLEIDFSKIDYINSVFIGHLAHWHNQLQNRQAELHILNPSQPVKDVLDLVGLSQVITIN